MQESPPPITTSVQFSLRSLLCVAVVFVILVAVFAPWFRLWGSTRQTYFVVMATAAITLLATAVCGFSWRRRITERSAGKILLRADSPRARLMRIWLIAMSTLLVSTLATQCVFYSQQLAREGNLWPRRSSILIILPVLNYVLLFAYLLPMHLSQLLWKLGPGLVEICENGLIFGGYRLVPWNKIKGYCWGTYDPRMLRVLLTGSGWQSVVIAPESKDDVDALIAQHVEAASQA